MTEEIPERRRAAPTWGLFFVLVLAALAYTPSIRAELQFDDQQLLLDRTLASVGTYLASIRELDGATNRPLTQLTFAATRSWAGADPLPYHAANVAIHLAATLLVFAFTQRLLRLFGAAGAAGAARPALATAALFAIHPLHSQAVSYVSQRAEILASALYVATLLLLLRADEAPRGPRRMAWRAGALVLCGLALLAKPIAMTLPLAYIALGWFLAGTARERARDLVRRTATMIPFLLLSATCAAGLLVRSRGHADFGFAIPALGPGRYALTQVRVVPTYLGLLFFPVGLNVDREFTLAAGGLDPATAASALLLVALLACAAYLTRWSRGRTGDLAAVARLAGFGVAWFFLLLAPTSSVVPLADVIEEHRVYLASWGIIAPVASVAVSAWRPGRRRGMGFALVAAGVLSTLTLGLHRRNEIWHSPSALWGDAAAKSPTKARAHFNFAHALSIAGEPARALAELELAATYRSDGTIRLPDLARNMGAVLVRVGRLGEAITILKEGVEVEPSDWILRYNLGLAYVAAGRLEEADESLRSAFVRSPGDPRVLASLGRVQLSRGDLPGAAATLERAVALDPAPSTLLDLARVHEQLGHAAEACGAWIRFARSFIDPAAASQAREHIARLRCGPP